MSAMADLVSHRVLRDGGHGLEFVNEFVRAAAYLEVPSPVRRALHTSVAERLMEEERRGVRFLALEIAWHATRAGRAAEVPAFLLRGAREALSQGALDAAARALRTALPQLATPDQCDARLLLAEVLQEQARWSESTAVLLGQEAAYSSAVGTVLVLLAEHRMAASTGETLIRAVTRLLGIIAEDPSHRVRLRAANAVAQLMGDVRDRSLSRAVLSAVERVHREDLTEDERPQLDLSLAQLLYYSGHHRAVLKVLTDLSEGLHERGCISSTLVRVHSGLGVLRCYNGEYERARTEFCTARAIALQIGNEAQEATLAANLALCCLRLGNYSENLKWSSRAAGIGCSRYQSLQVAYYHAFGLAMRGDAREALQTIAAQESKIPSDGAPWLLQAWKLHRADILYLCGQQAAAMAQARDAIPWPKPVLHAASFAGAFARWLALVARDEGALHTIRPVLDELGSNPSDYDAVDRAEITCARLIAHGSEDDEDDLSRLLTKDLTKLPPAVVTHLARLGALRVPEPQGSSWLRNAAQTSKALS
jgi:tetratricopeptide (TPR) repeat protein